MLRRSPFSRPALGLIAVVSASAFGGLSLEAATGSSLRVQVTDERGLPVRDAVVELHPATAGNGPIRFSWRMGMAQKDRKFVPGTLVIARGSTVAFPNLDTVRHSIYSFSQPARFEIDLYGRDQTRTHRFPIVGSVKLGCNIHDEMRGYIRVTDTPYAGKTDTNGYLTLSGLPGGAARLTIWHPQLRGPGNEMKESIRIGGGSQSRKVAVRLR